MSRTAPRTPRHGREAAPPPDATIRVFQAQPSAALAAIVKGFLVVEFPDSHDDVHLPDTSPVAAFTFRGGCQLDGK
jgi:hypothetical protein